MRLCDALEAKGRLEAEQHARLIGTLLGTLTASVTPEELAANWQRVSEHFDLLMDRPEAVEALAQIVMDLGIQGQLCSDASLNKWHTKRIDEFCSVQGGIQKTPHRRPVSSHFPYLRVANVQRGRVDVSELERYELFGDELERWRLNDGDLLVVEGNGSEKEVGRCAVWRGEVADCVYQNHLMRVRPTQGDNVDYLALYLNSSAGTVHMRRLAITTSGLFNLSVGKIRGIEVPLPPKDVQARIVTRANQLLKLCDELKASIGASQRQQERVAAVLVESAAG